MNGNNKAFLVSLLTLSLQLGGISVYANDVVGDNVTIKEHNAIPLVQINTPNSQGVSYNTYADFNIDNAVVLNNSVVDANSQLLGKVLANPNLQKSADIIVNEVVSTKPSQLNGTLEVAGQKADVVIANPNGITVNKLNFINTDRAVLTTGVPNNVNNKLDSISVNQGEITINGNINAPFNNHNSITRVDLFAKAIRLNANIFAQDKITVVTGSNKIGYEDNSITRLHNNTDLASGISLDVAALGGMYANTITMVGTPQGLGVNLEKHMDELTGELELDKSGNLTIVKYGSFSFPNSLNLTADTKADKNNQPIIDKTRNGIDLVNIAQVNGQGMSINKYIDFNVKPGGLIFNNATTFADTKLAGYIDKNMFLAGRGAKTIVNEVTSTNKSILNGFIEVAGNPADIAIVNPNGMVINGLGFVNSKNISLNTTDNIAIIGKGLNADNVDKLMLNSKDFNNNSEFIGKNISINADSINNTGLLNSKGTLYNQIEHYN